MIVQGKADQPLTSPTFVEDKTVTKVNKWAVGFLILCLLGIAATVTYPIYFEKLKYCVIGVGSFLSLVSLIMGAKFCKQAVPIVESSTPRYGSAVQSGFGSVESRLTVSEGTPEENLKNLGYKAYVDKHGTKHFEDNTIPVSSKSFQDAFLAYIENEKNLAQFLLCGYFGDFLYNHKQHTGSYLEIITKIRNLYGEYTDTEMTKDQLNRQWKLFLALRKATARPQE